LRRLTTKLQGATAEFARASGAGLLAAPVTLTAIRLGNVAFLGISAEVSYAIGAAIEKESPFSHTVVVGLSNGYCGYITDRDDYGEATYESLSSPFGPASAVVLAREAISLLRDLR
jgi:hypothetical protein